MDDEPSIRKFLRASLKQEGYDVIEAADGEEALQLMEQTLPDLVILDLVMPKLDGFEVCRQIREWSLVPIIVLSGRLEEAHKVRSLRLGADDYLTKPFGIDEMIARVEAVLSAERPSADPTFVSGELTVNFAERIVTVAGQEIRLTPVEYELLRQLVQHRGKVLTHRMLLQQVWGPEYADEREYVRVFVNRVRRKLSDDTANPRYIRTEPGVGYRFLAPA